VDESGFYQLPGEVKTYAPKGETADLEEWQKRDHLSVMGSLTLRGKGYVLAQPEPLTGLPTVTFLEHLVRYA